MPNAERTGCKRQSLSRSKEGRWRGEVTCVRTAQVRNRNRVQLVTPLSECMRFCPRIFLFSEANLPILPAVCTHCLQRNPGYSFFPHTYGFTDLLTATCTSAARSAQPRCDDLGGRRVGQERRKYFPLLLRLHFTEEWPLRFLLQAWVLCLPGILQGLLICPCSCLTLVTW